MCRDSVRDPEGRLAPSQLGLWEDTQTEGHRAIVDACHKHGTVMIVQIHHAGYNTHPECGPAKDHRYKMA